jgi:hypothetical protein
MYSSRLTGPVSWIAGFGFHARSTGAGAAWDRVRVDFRVRSHRAVGAATWLRQPRAIRERHCVDREPRGGHSDEPKHLPCQALDHATGYLAAFGAMVALVASGH